MATPEEELELEAREQAAVADAYFDWEDEGDQINEDVDRGADSGGFPRLAGATDAETGELWRRVDAALEKVRGD